MQETSKKMVQARNSVSDDAMLLNYVIFLPILLKEQHWLNGII